MRHKHLGSLGLFLALLAFHALAVEPLEETPAVAQGSTRRQPGQAGPPRRERASQPAAQPTKAAEPADGVLVRRDPLKLPRHFIGLGLGSGFNYYFPWLHYQFAVRRKFSLGVQGIYIQSSGNNIEQKAAGVFLTGAAYLSGPAFTGFWFEGGLGMYWLQATQPTGVSEANPFSTFLTVGWRGGTLRGFTLGLGAGFQYVFVSSGTTTGNISFSGLLPLFRLDIGYMF